MGFRARPGGASRGSRRRRRQRISTSHHRPLQRGRSGKAALTEKRRQRHVRARQ
ncbi:hypothetical protein SAY86_008119 [Trapa natans]|uniref:Uncharacterized protein n=1 Tax=Trapa natans TaxID=22666 RepID=A0AAN7KE59_TRANT|nr:hypothetical protein SAY86_008119 [Trapa natans]